MIDKHLEFWGHTCLPPDEVEQEYSAVTPTIYGRGDRHPDVEPNPEHQITGVPTIRASILSLMIRIHTSQGDSIKYPWKARVENIRPGGFGWVTVSDEGGWRFWPDDKE